MTVLFVFWVRLKSTLGYDLTADDANRMATFD